MWGPAAPAHQREGPEQVQIKSHGREEARHSLSDLKHHLQLVSGGNPLSSVQNDSFFFVFPSSFLTLQPIRQPLLYQTAFSMPTSRSCEMITGPCVCTRTWVGQAHAPQPVPHSVGLCFRGERRCDSCGPSSYRSSLSRCQKDG